LTGTGFLAFVHFDVCVYSLSYKPDDLLFSPNFFMIYTHRDTECFNVIRSNVSISALYLSIASVSNEQQVMEPRQRKFSNRINSVSL
jgi:hypothetical protein